MTGRGKRPYLVVVGPDGAGKTTVARLLVDRLARSGPVRHVHFNPWIDVREHDDGGGAVDPRAVPPRGRPGAALVVGVRWMRYRASAWVGPLSPRCAVVQERGWWDQIVDPVRYRTPPGLQRLVRLLGRTLRRPEAYVLCGGDPVAIAARKAELRPDEVAGQLRQWEAVLAGARVVRLDTVGGSSPSRAADEALSRLGVAGPWG